MLSIRDWSISTRLAAGFGLLVSLVVVMLIASVWRLSSLSSQSENILKDPIAKERIAGDVYRLVYMAVRRTTAIAKSSDTSLASFFSRIP